MHATWLGDNEKSFKTVWVILLSDHIAAQFVPRFWLFTHLFSFSDVLPLWDMNATKNTSSGLLPHCGGTAEAFQRVSTAEFNVEFDVCSLSLPSMVKLKMHTATKTCVTHVPMLTAWHLSTYWLTETRYIYTISMKIYFIYNFLNVPKMHLILLVLHILGDIM